MVSISKIVKGPVKAAPVSIFQIQALLTGMVLFILVRYSFMNENNKLRNKRRERVNLRICHVYSSETRQLNCMYKAYK